MKKFITYIVFLSIIVLACFCVYKSMLGPFSISDENIDYTEYEKLYYYSQLNKKQRELYIIMDLAINNLKPTINLGFYEKAENEMDVNKALDAIYKDRPEYYFLPNQYNINTISFFSKEYIYVQMKYEVKDTAERKMKDMELEREIKQFLYEAITDNMSDIEKQIAIHDKLVRQVTYYEYENIDDIPHSKHTAYEALVNNEAVCDGITRAFMLLLNRAGIYTISVSGTLNDIPHAWNIVKIDGEYYHVDATSNVVEMNSEKDVIHKYFNITDDEIKITHTISEDFKIPECKGTKYNYYLYNDFYIDYLDDMRNKIEKIINTQKGNGILELKIDKSYTTNDLLKTLYFVDFNKWSTNNVTSVEYHDLGNVYIFKNETRRNIYY